MKHLHLMNRRFRVLMLLCGILCLPILYAVLMAQNVPNFIPGQSIIKENDDGSLRIGLVNVDPSTRTLTLPAEVHMRNDPLEYALVGPYGKLHESLLKTNASPLHIHIAMLLLNVKAAKWVTKNEKPSPGSLVQIRVEWQNGSKKESTPLNQWIFNTETEKVIETHSWLYTGAHMQEGQLSIQPEQSYVSIIQDRKALVNSMHPDRENDDIWTPYTEKIPPIGTKVNIIIQPTHPEE